ncbi:lipid-A-disaccharide synthase N-terminal domain-containing protein [Hydrogenimonas urashimensis]|uniref:lipid-A-disaccharide synthase N-terminal domain-containing protein n=1 Tax=Hydrogenimonas urashimensis TaxID=2740515 RepID=UPI0019161E55|nr:lipid-A-disaccharide synthase N-terminal domain-containing protein [Hydrogenimonas urashimensis]
MSFSWWIYGIGFLAQALFSARLLVQWIHSERMRRVMTPELFWELSLLASFLMFVYGWLHDDFAIVLGQSVSYFIYIRNMQLQGTWSRLSRTLRGFLLLFPLLVLGYGFNNGEIDSARFFHNPAIPNWLLVWGSAGQLLFTFRFVYQWLLSERARHSHLPVGFWLISLAGSSMILLYAIWRRDPVLFIGQIFGFVVYGRNLWLYFLAKGRRIPDENRI